MSLRLNLIRQRCPRAQTFHFHTHSELIECHVNYATSILQTQSPKKPPGINFRHFDFIFGNNMIPEQLVN